MTLLIGATILATLVSAVTAGCHLSTCARSVTKRSASSRHFQLQLQIPGAVNSIFDGYWIQTAELLDGLYDSGREYTAIQPEREGGTTFHLDAEGRITTDGYGDDPRFGNRHVAYGGPVFFDSAVPRGADFMKNNDFLKCDGQSSSSQSDNPELVCAANKKHTQFYVCTGDVPGGPMYEALGRPYVRISDLGDGITGCAEASLLMMEYEL